MHGGDVAWQARHITYQLSGRCHVTDLAASSYMARQYSLDAPCLEARSK
jgi:hypothetical protein